MIKDTYRFNADVKDPVTPRPEIWNKYRVLDCSVARDGYII